MPPKKTGLDDLDYTLMMFVTESMTYEEMALRTAKTASSVQWRIKYLMDNGYITNKYDESMGRKARGLILTPKGSEVISSQGIAVTKKQVARGEPRKII